MPDQELPLTPDSLGDARQMEDRRLIARVGAEAAKLARRWRREATDHPARLAADLLLLCALELEAVLAAGGDSGGPGEAEELRNAIEDVEDTEAATWEAAAKMCEAYTASAHPMAKLELKDIAAALRARGADAER